MRFSQAAALGVLDGIATNPTLAAKEGQLFRELILATCSIQDATQSAGTGPLTPEYVWMLTRI